MAPNADDQHSDPHGGFPGGKAQLPRLSRPKRPIPPAAPTIDDAPAPPTAEEVDVDGTFTDYYSTESLFSASPDRDEHADGPEDAYRVLGLTRQASWKDISRTHRELVSMLHPDRYVDASAEIREAAERRVRDVNEAFSEIRRQRHTSNA